MNTGSEAKFNLSAWALKNQQMVSFLMLLVIAMGVFCYEKLPRNEDPAFTIKTAVVSAQWPGASVADTTRLLTDTLEKKLQETPWLDYLESETRAGRTVIHVNLRDDTPPQRVQDIWYQVRKKMQDIAPSLPEGVQDPAVDDEFDDTFGTIYAFIPEGFTLREVRDRAETIRRELMSLPDIGKTTLLGEQQEQWVLAFSPARLAGMGLDIQEVADALRTQNAVVPAGTMRTEKENMAIKVSGALMTEESLRAVTLHVNNRYIPLTDIATVTREIAEPPAPAYRVNGKPAIGLAVSMAPTGNMLRFGAALNARMAALSAGLPHGIEMVKVADQSAVVSDAVSGFKFGTRHAGIAFPRRGFKRPQMRTIDFVSLHQAYRLQRRRFFEVADQITQHGDVRLNHVRPVRRVRPGAVKDVGDTVQGVQRPCGILRIQ